MEFVSGHAFSEDLNGYRQEGVGWFDMTINKGKRWSAAEAYLRPALKTRQDQIRNRFNDRLFSLSGLSKMT